MVEVNGMLVSAAAAERRRFLSALVQRAAKRRSGGTLTLLLALPGTPASGERTAATRGRTPPSLDQYKHLSEELKAKMAKALAAKAAAEEAAAPLVGVVWLHSEHSVHLSCVPSPGSLQNLQRKADVPFKFEALSSFWNDA
jgi:hypothetical protein